MNLSLSSISRILGLTMLVVGLAMLPPFFVSIFDSSGSTTIAFAIPMGISLLSAAGLLYFFGDEDNINRTREALFVVVLLWFTGAVIGSLPFIISGKLGIIDGFFESCSMFSATGFTVLANIELTPVSLVLWRSIAAWISSLAFIIFAVALLPSIGLSGQDIMEPDEKTLAISRPTANTIKIIKFLFVVYMILTFSSFIMLSLSEMSCYDALIHSMGAVSTSGFSNYNEELKAFDDIYIKLVLAVVMIASTISYRVYYNLSIRKVRRHVHYSEPKFYLIVFGAGTAVTTIMAIIKGLSESLASTFADSLFQTASMLSTTGYIGADHLIWPIAGRMILFMLVLIGGCTSSAGSGFKAVRALTIGKLIHKGISDRLHPNAVSTVMINDRMMPAGTASKVVNLLYTYIALIFFTGFVVSFENLNLISSFSVAMGAATNTGVCIGVTGMPFDPTIFHGFTKLFLSGVMMAGRLEILPVAILMTRSFWRAD